MITYDSDEKDITDFLNIASTCLECVRYFYDLPFKQKIDIEKCICILKKLKLEERR